VRTAATEIPDFGPPRESGEEQRLNRILSLSGVTSRRKADEWIAEGRVTVNGKTVAEAGAKARWGVDRIAVDGRPVPAPAPRVYLMLNKPFAVMCSLNDPEGRPTVAEYLKDLPVRVYPVGRLDFDTLGLLLFTNDGDWAFRLSHPRYRVPRTYKATLAGEIAEGDLAALRRGVPLEDGPSGPATVTVVSRGPEQSVIRITITRGRNRQVRRMIETLGYRIIHLIRIGFGPLALGDLKIGRYRFLTPSEVEELRSLVGLP